MEIVGGKPTPVPLYAAHSSHRLARDRNRASAVTSRRLGVRTMALPASDRAPEPWHVHKSDTVWFATCSIAFLYTQRLWDGMAQLRVGGGGRISFFNDGLDRPWGRHNA